MRQSGQRSVGRKSSARECKGAEPGGLLTRDDPRQKKVRKRRHDECLGTATTVDYEKSMVPRLEDGRLFSALVKALALSRFSGKTGTRCDVSFAVTA